MLNGSILAGLSSECSKKLAAELVQAGVTFTDVLEPFHINCPKQRHCRVYGASGPQKNLTCEGSPAIAPEPLNHMEAEALGWKRWAIRGALKLTRRKDRCPLGK